MNGLKLFEQCFCLLHILCGFYILTSSGISAKPHPLLSLHFEKIMEYKRPNTLDIGKSVKSAAKTLYPFANKEVLLSLPKNNNTNTTASQMSDPGQSKIFNVNRNVDEKRSIDEPDTANAYAPVVPTIEITHDIEEELDRIMIDNININENPDTTSCENYNEGKYDDKMGIKMQEFNSETISVNNAAVTNGIDRNDSEEQIYADMILPGENSNDHKNNSVGKRSIATVPADVDKSDERKGKKVESSNDIDIPYNDVDDRKSSRDNTYGEK